MEIQLALSGLFLTFIGACLLFVYGLPRKQIGNTLIWGLTAMKCSPEAEKRDMPQSEWQPIADRFLKRATFLNGTGFALVAVGTLLQMIAIWIGAGN